MNAANPMDFIKESVSRKKVYSLPDIDYDIKINQNENPIDLPADIKQEILSAIEARSWNRYPRLGSEKLRNRLGSSLGISGESVMVGNGSNEVMLAMMNALLEEGRKMVTIEPTFTLYRHYAEILGAEVVAVPLSSELEYQPELLRTAISDSQVALTILCSPNNPTGSVIAESDLRTILEVSNGYVLVDEAYIDFSKQDFLPLLNEYQNLILTRTFSKAFAFAFGRFGYGIARPEFVREIYKVLLPYNLNGFTDTAADVLIEKRGQLQPVIDSLIEQRTWLYQKLQKFPGLKVYPSQANFLLIEPEMESDTLYKNLMERKILVRDVSYYPGLGNHLRISVGTDEENRMVIEALQGLLPEAASA